MRSAFPHRPSAVYSILLVDDNADGNLARRSVLEELGYAVVLAASGSEALRVVEEQQFDLVITDYRMEALDGVELIRMLRERSFRNPIILLTGFAEKLGLRPESTGADVIIQKSANEILTLIRQVKRLLNAPRKPVSSHAKRVSSSKRLKQG